MLYIGNTAFLNCRALKSIEIPNSVIDIGYGLFLNCVSLESIEIPDSLTSIESNMFNECNSLTSIKIPNTITSIGVHAFHKCNNLTNIDIPENVTEIGGAAFYGCKSLTSIELPEGLTSIDLQMFYECSSLKTVKVPSCLISINDEAFYGCESLTNIELPEGLMKIGENAFLGCSNLKKFEIPSSITNIGNFAFAWCSSLQSIKVNENNKNYMDDNGVLYTKDQTKIIKYPEAKEETEYAILNDTTNIEIYAFCDCNNLTQIYIPDSVKTINGTAFYQCEKISIICKSGSIAETFAKEKEISYEVDDEAPSMIIMSQSTYDSIIVNIDEITDVGAGIDEKSCKYYIKEYGEYGQGIRDGYSHIFTNLKSETKYYIKVEILDKVGNIASTEIEVTTSEDKNITSTTHIVDEENLIIKEITPGTTVEEIKENLQSDISYEIQDKNGNPISEDAKIGTGCKLKMQNNKIYTFIVTGDCNGDGKITVNKDIIKMNAHRLSGKGLSAEYFLAADVDQDGVIKVKDIILINAIRLKQKKNLP